MSTDMLMRYFLASQIAKGSKAPKKDVPRIAILSGMMPSLPLSVVVARSMAKGAGERDHGEYREGVYYGDHGSGYGDDIAQREEHLAWREERLAKREADEAGREDRETKREQSAAQSSAKQSAADKNVVKTSSGDPLGT